MSAPDGWDPTPEERRAFTRAEIEALALNSDLARCVLVIAANGGMPDTFWQTDSRIALAAKTMNLEPDAAREWARDNADWSPA